MSRIEITASRPEHGRHAARPALWSRQSQLNDAVARLLMVLVALAPVPLGSNRGFFWAVTAVAVGLIGVFYAYRLGRLGEPPRYDLKHMRALVVLSAGLGIFLVLQTVPFSLLGPWADFARHSLSIGLQGGATLEANTISLAPQSTWLMLLRMVTYAVFYLLMLQVTTNHRRKAFVLNSVLLIVTLYAIYGFLSLMQFGDTILGLPKWAYAGSATATFVNANSFATFLAFGSVTAMALVAGKLVRDDDEHDGMATNRWFDPTVLLYLLAYAIIIAALFATQSRMGSAAAIAGSLTVVVVSAMRARRPVRLVGVLTVFALAGALGFATYGQGLLARLGSVESSYDVRFDLYAQVVQMILARPYLGYGGGAFELAFPLFHQGPVSADVVWDRAHNSYLALWVELGIIVGSIPIVLLLLAGLRIIRGLDKVRPDWTAKLAGLGVLVVGAVHSLVDFSLEIQANTLLFLAILATGVAGVAHKAHPAKR
jgi:O-antigen ligase